MSRLDDYLTTTPADEDDAAAAREARREAASESRAEAAQYPLPPSRPMRVFADSVWDSERKCRVPDTVGVLVYREDFVK